MSETRKNEESSKDEKKKDKDKDKTVVKKAPQLDFQFAFGISTNIRDCVAFVDDSTMIYALGPHLILYNMMDSQKKQRCIMSDSQVEKVLAMAVSPTKKHVAVCERLLQEGVVTCQITVYAVQTLASVRTLVFKESEMTGAEAVCLAFSHDGKSLAAQYEGADWPLVHWHWSQQKVVSVAKVHSRVSRISFLPTDNNTIVTSGNYLLKMWRIADGQLKGFSIGASKGLRDQAIASVNLGTHDNPLRDAGNNPNELNYIFTDHCWISDELMIAVTRQGHILPIENGEVTHIIRSVHGPVKTVDCICPLGRGFIVAGGSGTLSLWDRQKTREKADQPFTMIKRVCAELDKAVCCLTVPPSDDLCVAAFANQQLGTFHITNIDVLKDDQDPFTYVAEGFHSGGIRSIDTCIRRPYVASCSDDKSVRVWNYHSLQCEITKTFHSDPLSVALHPSGFHAVVGFSDRLRFFNILQNDLVLFSEISVKACKLIRFSHGGQLIAAVSQTYIYIISTYTLEMIGVLKGHTQPVSAVSWSVDDSILVSAGRDGGLYEWSVNTLKRLEENVLKTCQYSVCAFFNNKAEDDNKNLSGHCVVAGGSDGMIRQVLEGNVVAEYSTENAKFTAMHFTKDENFLYVSTSEGCLRVYPFPLQKGKFDEIRISTGAVTSFCLTSDDSYMFLATADGGLVMMKMKFDLAQEIQPKRFFDLVLVSRQDMDDRKLEVNELSSKLKDLQSTTDLKLHLKDQQWSEQVTVLKDHNKILEDEWSEKYERLLDDKKAKETELIQRMERMEVMHMKAADELETLYERKLAQEAQRYQALKDLSEDRECMLDEKISGMQEEHEMAMEELREEYESKMKKLSDRLQQMEQTKNDLVRRYEEEIRQQETEYEKELQDQRERMQNSLLDQKRMSHDLKGEADFLRRKFDNFKKEKEDLLRSLGHRESEIRDLNRQIVDLQGQISVLKKDIREREEAIENKERRLAEIKVKNKELEKFKYVMDYKLTLMRNEIEPRDEQIEAMREQLKEMDEELEKDLRKSSQMERHLAERDAKLAGLVREIRHQRSVVSSKERFINHFCQDLDNIVTSVEPMHWRDALRHLHRTYVKQDGENTGKDAAPETRSGADEFLRQRDFLERSLNHVKKKTTYTEAQMKRDFHKRTQENTVLLDELNKVRVLNKEMKLRIKQLEEESEKLKRGKGLADVAMSGDKRPATSATVRSAVTTSTRPSTRAQKNQPRIVKGSTWQLAHAYSGDTAKMAELLLSLEENNREMSAQREEIRRLRAQVQSFLPASDSKVSTNADSATPASFLPPATPTQLEDDGRPRPHTAQAEPVGGNRGMRPMTATTEARNSRRAVSAGTLRAKPISESSNYGLVLPPAGASGSGGGA